MTTEVKITYVLGNAGDGSNFVKWVLDPQVLDKMGELADDGDEAYASGDGLQKRVLKFKDQETLDDFIKRNKLYITVMEDFE